MPTYKQQFDKLTTAYIANKIDPYYDCACFIGNLLGGRSWCGIRRSGSAIGNGQLKEKNELIDFNYFGLNFKQGEQFISYRSEGLYTPEDILIMKNNFLHIINKRTVDIEEGEDLPTFAIKGHPNYENALFEAFESTLEILKVIHERSGEVIDTPFTFIKRQSHALQSVEA